MMVAILDFVAIYKDYLPLQKQAIIAFLFITLELSKLSQKKAEILELKIGILYCVKKKNVRTPYTIFLNFTISIAFHNLFVFNLSRMVQRSTVNFKTTDHENLLKLAIIETIQMSVQAMQSV